jgi:hypothetical protein
VIALLIWKIIGLTILGVFLFGIAATIFSAIVTIVTVIGSPFAFVAFYLLCVITYPLTVVMRLLGIQCRSFFSFSCDTYNAYKRKKERNETNSYQNHTHQQYQEPPKPAPKAPKFNPWSILGVEKGASKEAINAAYRQKMMLNHPDKVATLDPALQDYATKRTVLIKQAYDELKKAS